jgi:hypothetical protein
MLVNLLLNKLDRVQILVVEMSKQVDIFSQTIDIDDKDGWKNIYLEMTLFLEVRILKLELPQKAQTRFQCKT